VVVVEYQVTSCFIVWFVSNTLQQIHTVYNKKSRRVIIQVYTQSSVIWSSWRFGKSDVFASMWTKLIYFLYNKKPTDALISKFILLRNSTCFGQFLCPKHIGFRKENKSGWSCTQAVVIPVQHVPVPNVQWITLEDGQRNCPKHVDFPTRINLEISAFVGFYCKEICYDARSNECKK